MARTVNVVCVGDSLTEGPYPDVLKQLLSSSEPACTWNVRRWAFVGTDTQHWLDILQGRSPSNMPVIGSGAGNSLQQYAGTDVFVVMLGTNDAQIGLGPRCENRTRERLTQVVKQFMSQGALVILVTPPPIDDIGPFAQLLDKSFTNSALPKICSQVAAAVGCGSADAFSACGGSMPKREAFVDGVHLSPLGDKMVANAVLGPLVRIIMSKGEGGNWAARPCEAGGNVTSTVMPMAAPFKAAGGNVTSTVMPRAASFNAAGGNVTPTVRPMGAPFNAAGGNVTSTVMPPAASFNTWSGTVTPTVRPMGASFNSAGGNVTSTVMPMAASFNAAGGNVRASVRPMAASFNAAGRNVASTVTPMAASFNPAGGNVTPTVRPMAATFNAAGGIVTSTVMPMAASFNARVGQVSIQGAPARM